MSKPTKRRRAKQRRPAFFKKNRNLLALLVGAGLLVVGLVLLARMEEPAPVAIAPPPVTQPPVAPPPPVDYTRQVHGEVDAFLSGLAVPPEAIQRDLDQQPARYTVTGPFPPDAAIDELRGRLQGIPGDYAVRYREANSLMIDQGRQPLVLVHFLVPRPALPEGPLVAIIMDDLGRSPRTARELAGLLQPVTFAVLPSEPHAAEVAEIAYAAGREVILHAPMEPQGYPAVNPGDDALFVTQSSDEIRRSFDRQLAGIPHAVGANNHMGSRFTEDAEALRPVMESLRAKGLFFIDSRTSGQSKGVAVARKFGVPALNRDVFLDNDADVQAISRQIRLLEEKTRRQGMAVGICHPYPETLEALRRELPGMVARGITVVPVSVLLRKQAMLQGS